MEMLSVQIWEEIHFSTEELRSCDDLTKPLLESLHRAKDISDTLRERVQTIRSSHEDKVYPRPESIILTQKKFRTSLFLFLRIILDSSSGLASGNFSEQCQ